MVLLNLLVTTVTLDSSGGITLDADGGTITFADAGSSLGYNNFQMGILEML